MNLFVATGFKNELFVNLNYLRGIENKPQLNNKENEILNNLNSEKIENKDYFEKLLNTNLIDVNELYQLIVLHEQRHYFSMSNDMITNVKNIIMSLDNKIKQEPDLTNINKIAIFVSTYQMQKERLKNGLDFYKSKKDGKDPEKIYLLTGYRGIYLQELVQLNVILSEDLAKVKNDGNLNNLKTSGLIDFVSQNNNEYLKFFNRENMIKTLENLQKSSPSFKDIKINKDDDTLKLLTLLASIKEKDLFELGKYELNIPNNNVEVVFSDSTNGSNILHGENPKNTVKRANTEDTLVELFKKDPEFDKILFVSNDAFVSQQFVSTLTIQKDINNLKVGKAYGKNSQHGDQRTIAARHYGIGPIVAKLLNSSNVDYKKYLGGGNVRVLEGKTPDEAYKIAVEAVSQKIR